MTPERHARIGELFSAVVALPPESWAAFLDRECGSDSDLRREVETLLARDARPAALDATMLGSGFQRALSDSRADDEARPTRIGPYQIVSVLGQGGMGTVYRARQSNPEREVAVKVLDGVAPALRRRFEFEALVLARLQHPGIAQIYDAGVADDRGRPAAYFAMELIEGLPLCEFADRDALGLRERLRLVQQVCEAVAHAHQKGVIHRDLKPANILVDGRGLPRVLDFGVARLLDPELRSATFVTETGQIIGTPAYMSPEQVEGIPEKIDVRTDVYALGVILYQLLTGGFPYDVSGPMRSVMDRIVRDEPIRPSVALKSGAASLAARLPAATSDLTRAASTLRRASAGLNDEVETITLKCLAKERERRYQSAGELGRDIGRFLAGDPIEAKRDSAMYLFRKTLRRYRTVVAFGAVLAIVLVAATVISIRLALGEAAQRRLADQRATETEAVARFQADMLSQIDIEAMGRGLADEYRAQVRAGLERRAGGRTADHRRTPEEIEAALAAFDQVAAPAEAVDVARLLLDRFVLGRAAGAIQKQFAEQPLVRARLHTALGSTYIALGLAAQAETHLRAALELRITLLGPDHLDTAESHSALGNCLHDLKGPAAAEPHYREALRVRQALLGAADRSTAMALGDLGTCLSGMRRYDEAERLQREALATLRQIGGERDSKVAGALSNLAQTLTEKGDLGAAEELLRAALEIHRAASGAASEPVALSLNNLANLLTTMGRLRDAEPVQRESLEIWRAQLGDEHPRTIIALHNLGNTLLELGRLAEAEPCFREALALRTRLRGRDDPDNAGSLLGLALVLQGQGALEAAEPPLREALALLRATAGENSKPYAAAMNNLAALLHARRDFDAAEPIYREVLTLQRRLLGPNHVDLGGTLNNLAAMLRDRGDLAAAVPLYREAIAIFRAHGGMHANLSGCLQGLARTLFGLTNFAEAEPLFREALDLQTRELPPGNDRLVGTQVRLARTLMRLGRLPEAEALLQGVADVVIPATGELSALGRSIAEALVELYDARATTQPAGEAVDRAAAWRARLGPTATQGG